LIIYDPADGEDRKIGSEEERKSFCFLLFADLLLFLTS